MAVCEGQKDPPGSCIAAKLRVMIYGPHGSIGAAFIQAHCSLPSVGPIVGISDIDFWLNPNMQAGLAELRCQHLLL